MTFTDSVLNELTSGRILLATRGGRLESDTTGDSFIKCRTQWGSKWDILGLSVGAVCLLNCILLVADQQQFNTRHSVVCSLQYSFLKWHMFDRNRIRKFNIDVYYWIELLLPHKLVHFKQCHFKVANGSGKNRFTPVSVSVLAAEKWFRSFRNRGRLDRFYYQWMMFVL